MRTRPTERGYTLIESMLALAVMLVGAMGIAALYTTGVQMNGDARRMTRATAIAQDLLNNIAIWPYSEASGTPLANANPSNDGDIGDAAYAFQLAADPLGAGLADHGEADLTALGVLWTGIPTAELGGEYERYWNVKYVDTNGNGVNDLAQIAVIVRWPHGAGWRRIVLITAKLNPGGS